MLEAREVCSGATGRNGGNSRPEWLGSYRGYKEQFGKDQAQNIINDEFANFAETKRLVEDYNIDCDANYSGETYMAWTTKEVDKYAREVMMEYKKDGGNMSGFHMTSNSEEAAKLTRVTNVVGAASWPAATLYPFKLVEALVTRAISAGLNLQTSTPTTTNITRANENGLWTVETLRGCITTPTVIHATNAYASAVLPSLTKHLDPVKAMCGAIVLPLKCSGKNMIKDSIAICPNLDEGNYLMQRPKDGYIIVGAYGTGEGKYKEQLRGTVDDSTVLDELREHLGTFLGQTYGEWQEEWNGEGLESVWSGIIGKNIAYILEYSDKGWHPFCWVGSRTPWAIRLCRISGTWNVAHSDCSARSSSFGR